MVRNSITRPIIAPTLASMLHFLMMLDEVAALLAFDGSIRDCEGPEDAVVAELVENTDGVETETFSDEVATIREVCDADVV